MVQFKIPTTILEAELKQKNLWQLDNTKKGWVIGRMKLVYKNHMKKLWLLAGEIGTKAETDKLILEKEWENQE